ncbi:MAG: hypothetical protein DMG24_13550 [Acidobacteria bacterium]|nr:MAG: hypothetical protein DMG24_13550 [Acidobacteriota bacterium]
MIMKARVTRGAASGCSPAAQSTWSARTNKRRRTGRARRIFGPRAGSACPGSCGRAAAQHSAAMRDAGFSLLEVSFAALVIGIIAALALPFALNSLGDYRLNSDAVEISSFINVAPVKAASQYAPYRMNVNVSAGTYALEKLCGNTPSSGTGSDSNCTSAYKPFTTPNYDGRQVTLSRAADRPGSAPIRARSQPIPRGARAAGRTRSSFISTRAAPRWTAGAIR